MALQKQLYSIPFGQGLDSETDERVLPVGKLTTLDNGIIDKKGQVSKRSGLTKLGTIPDHFTTPKPYSLYAFEDQILVQDNYGLVSVYNPGEDSWNDSIYRVSGIDAPFTGQIARCETSLMLASDSAKVSNLSPSSAMSYDGKYICVCWVAKDTSYITSTGSVLYELSTRYSILEASTGKILHSFSLSPAPKPGPLDASTPPGKQVVVPYGASDFYIYQDYYTTSGTTWEVRRAPITSSSGLSGSNQDIVTVANYEDTTGERAFDVVVGTAANSTVHHIAWTKDDSGTNTIEYLQLTGTTPSTAESVTYALTTKAVFDLSINIVTVSSVARIYIAYFEKDGSNNHDIRVREQLESDPDATATHYLSSFDTSSTACTHGTTSVCLSENQASVALVVSSDLGDGLDFILRTDITPATATGAMTQLGLMYQVRATTSCFRAHDTVMLGIIPSYRSTFTEPFTTISLVRFGSPDLLTVSNTTGTLTNGNVQILGRTLVNSYLRTQDVRGGNVVPETRISKVISSGTTFYFPKAKATNLQTIYANVLGASATVDSVYNSRIEVVKIDTSPVAGSKPQLSRASIGKNLFVAAGMLSSYDGNYITDHGIPFKPALTMDSAASGGDLDGSATYQYIGVFEWEDAQGNLYRSEPSDAVQGDTTGSNKKFTINAANHYTPTNIQTFTLSGLRLNIYRTQGNGLTFNRVSTIDMDSGAASQKSITDSLSDALAATGQVLYTDGDVLADVTPPACRYIASHRNRLFLIAEDNRVWFSKTVEEGFAVAFSDAFVIELDGMDDDRPVALGSLANMLVIFRERSIWTISGEGPSNTGAGGFYDPRRISATVGASDRTPTATINEGIFFQSPKGIHLTNGQTVEYIGGAVEDELGTDSILAMDVHQPTETVRFTLPQKTIVFNYRFKQWGTFSHPTIATGAAKWSDSVTIDNVQYTGLTTAASVYKSDATFYDDTSGYIPLKMKTAWVKFEAVQGFLRTYLFHILGLSKNAHDLTVKVRYDYNDTVVDTFSLVNSGTSEVLLQFRGFLSKQKCQTLQFELEDAAHASTDTGEGYVVNEVQLTVGAKKGGFRLPESGSTVGAD